MPKLIKIFFQKMKIVEEQQHWAVIFDTQIYNYIKVILSILGIR